MGRKTLTESFSVLTLMIEWQKGHQAFPPKKTFH